ncbi:MAG: hypothetical protein JWR01_2335, partial [Subtercola sp.]|nr:hypothetical protein [Subtercola sp.]
ASVSMGIRQAASGSCSGADDRRHGVPTIERMVGATAAGCSGVSELTINQPSSTTTLFHPGSTGPDLLYYATASGIRVTRAQRQKH